MPRVRLKAGEVARELLDFERRLARAPLALAGGFDPHTGATPRDLVSRLEGTTLYRYASARRNAALPPLLVVYALVNRPYMADLLPDRSLVAAMLERGLDIYLVEWGEPHGGLTLADYVERYLDAHVEAVRRDSGQGAIDLLGICQGGVFSLCYTALHPDKVRRLVTTVTPVDFHTPHDALSRLVRHVEPALIDGARGVLPGAALNALFLLLKPYRLTQLKYLEMLEQIDDAEAVRLFLKMERWIFDSPALAVPALREFVSTFYHGNGFVAGRVEIGGREVKLRELRTPILNVYAKDDHLVPPEASRALGALLGSAAYSEYELPGGHIGMYVGKSSAARVAGTVAQWLAQR